MSLLMIPIQDKDSKKYQEKSRSQDLLIRGGYINQSAAGIYSFLYLGMRTMEKLERIIEVEMDKIGSQKVKLPLLSAAEPWKKTNRWDTNGPEMFKLKDRKNADFCLAPTHEEEITRMVAEFLPTLSTKQFPILLYQIGSKFRDELRPRAGLLRGREFIMKDLYSFDLDEDAATKTYDIVSQAYHNIFTSLGVPYVAALADSGNIGGKKSHEYHFLSEAGDDKILKCNHCGYAANEERAEGRIANNDLKVTHETEAEILMETVIQKHPNLFPPNFSVLKSGLRVSNFRDPESPELVVFVLHKSNRRPSNFKFKNYEDLKELNLIQQKTLSVDLLKNMTILIDSNTTSRSEIFYDSDADLNIYIVSGGFTFVEENDGCPNCHDGENGNSYDHALELKRGIEVGHTFFLGTKYAKPLKAKVKTEKNGSEYVQMGCYGIGISRVLAAVVEAKNDADGIIWPFKIAPFSLHVIANQSQKSDDVIEVALNFSSRLSQKLDIDVIVDERIKKKFSSKMHDALLIGSPIIVIVNGDNAYKVRERQNEQIVDMSEEQIIDLLKTQIGNIS
ncbi:hypothetical protein HK096_006145 [Nowakowskiella sp. JEL0078]|nr:hypothetical protein HK096_006145 [Nowakowskiella sp. JEL0078]